MEADLGQLACGEVWMVSRRGRSEHVYTGRSERPATHPVRDKRDTYQSLKHTQTNTIKTEINTHRDITYTNTGSLPCCSLVAAISPQQSRMPLSSSALCLSNRYGLSWPSWIRRTTTDGAAGTHTTCNQQVVAIICVLILCNSVFSTWCE